MLKNYLLRIPCCKCGKMIIAKSASKRYCDKCLVERNNRLSLDKYYICLSKGERGIGGKRKDEI